MKIIVRNKANASLFSRSVQFWVFLQYTYSWFYAVNLLTRWTILLTKCFLVLLWPVSLLIYLETTYILVVDFCRASKIVSPIHGSDSDLSPSMFQFSSMVASWSTSRLVFVSLNINMIQRYRKIVSWNSFVLGATWYWKMKSPIILQKSCRASRSGFGSWASPSFSEGVSWSSCLRSPPAWKTVVDNGCPSYNFSPVLHGTTIPFSLFLMPTYFLYDLEVNFRWWHRFGIFHIRYQQNHQCNFPARSRRIPWIFEEGLFVPSWCTRPENFTSPLKGMIGPSNGELNWRS